MSAMVVSSVSPERCEITEVYPFSLASSTESKVSVRVPIWLTLTRIEFATPWSIPFLEKSTSDLRCPYSEVRL